MAKSKKAQAEEESFYDSFLTPTEERTQPAVTTGDDPLASAPVTSSPPANDTPSTTQGASETSQDAVAETPETNVPAQAAIQPANTGRGVGRRRDPDYMQASAYVPRLLRRQVERVLLNDPGERDYSELIEELLEKWLTDQGMSA